MLSVDSVAFIWDKPFRGISPVFFIWLIEKRGLLTILWSIPIRINQSPIIPNGIMIKIMTEKGGGSDFQSNP